LEKRVPLPIEGPNRLELWHRVTLARDRPIGVQYVDAYARRFTLEDTDADTVSRRPIGLDDELRLRLHELEGLPLPLFDRRGINQPGGFKPRRIGWNRIARRPIFVALAIHVAAVGDRRILPPEGRVFAEIQHVVVVRVAA